MAKVPYVDKINNTPIFAERAEYSKGGKNLDSSLDDKIEKVATATSGNLAAFDAGGAVVDSNQAAANLVHDANYVHTDNNYTTAEKNKLSGIAAGAEVNVQSDWNQTTTTADDYIKNKPENLVQDANYVHTDNNYTTAEKNKLSGIAPNAQVNVIETVKVNGTTQTVTSKAIDISVPTAGTSNPSMDGNASAGSATTWSKSDHVHPTDTSREATANKDSSIPTSPVSGHYPSTEAVVQFVNSSISTNTANFLGTYDVVTDLGLTTSATNAQIASALNSYTFPTGTTVTNNDYVFVSINYSSTTDVDEYRRFKYSDASNGSWAYEYTLNNSSFTQAQWDAINSAITSTKVGNYDTHIANTNNPHGVTKAQIGLENVGNFLAVSTAANQGLTDTQKSNARANIGAGTYSKPSSGIPDSDIESASTWNGKQDSLGINSSTGDAAKFLNEKGQFVATSVSVSDNNPTLSWGTTSKVGTVDSTDLRVTMPANPAADKLTFYNIDSSLTSLDLNSLTTQGFYYCRGFTSSSVTLTNIPSEMNNYTKSWRLEVINQRSRVEQVLINASDNGVNETIVMGIWKRHCFSNGNWTPWVAMRDASWINSGTFGTDRIADDAITAAKVKDNETLPVNVSGSASKSVFYNASNTIGSTSYLKIGNIQSSNGEQRDCVFLATTPDGIGSNTPVTYLVTVCNRRGVHKVSYTKITPENASSVYLSSFGYVLKNDGSIDVMMYRPEYSGTTDIIMLHEGNLVSSFEKNADGTNYVAGVRYETVMVTQQVGSTSIPVYVDANGQIQPCDTSQMTVHNATYATNVNLYGHVKTISTTDGDTIQVQAGHGEAAEITIGNAKHAASADSANSVAWGNVSGKPGSFTPASHTHGNIQNGGTLQTNDVTIASGDKLVVTDSSDSSKVARTSVSFDGSTTTKALTPKGTFETFLQSHQGVTANNPTLAWSTTSTVGTVGSTALKVTLPANPNTDKTVKATAKTDNVNYKILATASSSPTSGSLTEAVYDTDITLNPSTNTIAANISGQAEKAYKTSSGVIIDQRFSGIESGMGTINAALDTKFDASTSNVQPYDYGTITPSDTDTMIDYASAPIRRIALVYLYIKNTSSSETCNFYIRLKQNSKNLFQQVFNLAAYQVATVPLAAATDTYQAEIWIQRYGSGHVTALKIQSIWVNFRY